MCLRPIKRKIRKFHVEVVQRRQSNVQKGGCTLACEQAFLFGRAKRVSRERARERRSREEQGPLDRSNRRACSQARCTCKVVVLLFCHSKPIEILMFSLPSPSSSVKCPLSSGLCFQTTGARIGSIDAIYTSFYSMNPHSFPQKTMRSKDWTRGTAEIEPRGSIITWYNMIFC